MPARPRTRRNARPPHLSALLRLLAAFVLWVFAAPLWASTYAFKSDTYSWETTANTITGWDSTCTTYPTDDDKVTLNFTGGFTFTFAGTAYSSVRVLSNGMLQFGAADQGFHRTYTNTTLPAAAPAAYTGCNSATPTNVIMGYWVDLNPKTGGTVTWEQKGTSPNRYFVVSWNSVPQYGTSTPYTFQIILFENGEFKYQYGNANASGSNATIGVQVSSSDYTLYSFKSGYNANGSAIRWFVASGSPSRVANYRFDEFSYSGAVGEAIDASGNSHNGTAVGGAQTTANGKVCRGLDIPANTTNTTVGVDSLVNVPSLLGYDGSVSFWFNSNAVWTSNTAAMLVDATTTATRPFYVMRAGGGALKFAVADSAGTILTATTPAQSFAAGTWVHVAVTWRLNSSSNGSVLRIYINGVQQAVTNGTTNGNVDPSIGSLLIGDNRSPVTPSGGTVNSANGVIDEVAVYNYEVSTVEISADMNVVHGCSTLHHLEIRGSGSGLTCTPSTFTIAACQDSACTVSYTGGVTGTLSATGSTALYWPDGTAINIPSGSSSVSMRMQLLNTSNSVTLGAVAGSPVAANATSCNFTGCSYSAADSGLLFSSIANHVADTTQSFTISAVKKSDSSLSCTPAFASVTKTVNFACSYVNPTSGSWAPQVAGAALNSAGSATAACDSGGKNLSLNFNASGVASTATISGVSTALNLRYADVGRIQLTATYTGSGSDSGLSMTGSASFIVAPNDFGVTATSGTQRAGSAFTVTVTARNSSNAATPNFGHETTPEGVAVTHALYRPAGGSAGALAGSLGSFTNGIASGSFTWSEVGNIDLNAALANTYGYLGTAGSPTNLSATGKTGTTGAVGPFVPHHFITTVTQACPTGAFTYYDQPFAASVKAMNGLSTPTVTTNYDGALNFIIGGASRTIAQPVTLSDAGGLGGTFSPASTVAASGFTNGIAALTLQYGGFATKQNNPGTLILRATELVDGVKSVGYTEGQTVVRSGRLRLANGFGSEKSLLILPVTAEYWNGSAWVKNGDDSCSQVSSGAVVVSNVRNAQGGTGSWSTTATGPGTLAGGSGTITLSAPTGAATGSLDLAVNLGSSPSSDQSCNLSHASSSGMGEQWLRSRNGAGPAAACSGSPWDRDPSAHVSFGIYSPESKKAVHVHEIF